MGGLPGDLELPAEMPAEGASAHAELAAAVRQCDRRLRGDWLDQVRASLPALRGMSDEEVLDNLPPLLEAIATALEDPVRGHAALTLVGGVHGLTRFHQKLTSSDLGQEYPLLRQLLVSASRRELGRRLSESESDTLHGLIDRVIHLSNTSYASLQEKEIRLESEATGRYLAMLSHDLRNTLNAAMLSLDLASQRLREKSWPGMEDLSTEIDESRRMAFGAVEAMGRLLEAERLRGGGVRINVQAVDVCSLLASVRAASGRAQEVQAGQSAAALVAQVQIECAAETVIRTDPDLLSTVLQNLVGNALRYAGGAPIILRAGWQPAGSESAPSPFVIEVMDEGPGIAPEQLPKIFAPYKRGTDGESAGGASSGSVGLGLFIARRAAELLGAQLEVRSQLGRGTTFTLSMPQV